jgi:hypothetical protein
MIETSATRKTGPAVQQVIFVVMTLAPRLGYAYGTPQIMGSRIAIFVGVQMTALSGLNA